MDWIGCGSEHGHTSWIGLDWVSEFVNWIYQNGPMSNVSLDVRPA